MIGGDKNLKDTWADIFTKPIVPCSRTYKTSIEFKLCESSHRKLLLTNVIVGVLMKNPSNKNNYNMTRKSGNKYFGFRLNAFLFDKKTKRNHANQNSIEYFSNNFEPKEIRITNTDSQNRTVFRNSDIFNIEYFHRSKILKFSNNRGFSFSHSFNAENFNFLFRLARSEESGSG